MVATPLQANASPAPIIVIDGAGRRTTLTTYGVVASTASTISTNVIVSSPVCVVVWGGAHSAAPNTPSTIAATAMCSRRPACSCSIRRPNHSSTIRPAASVGCTTTSGTSSSATSCNGQPSIEMPVPSSQRARPIRSRASPRRRCSACGARLASIACSTTPRL